MLRMRWKIRLLDIEGGGVSYNSNRWESGFKLDIPEFKGCLQPKEFLDWVAAIEEIFGV